MRLKEGPFSMIGDVVNKGIDTITTKVDKNNNKTISVTYNDIKKLFKNSNDPARIVADTYNKVNRFKDLNAVLFPNRQIIQFVFSGKNIPSKTSRVSQSPTQSSQSDLSTQLIPEGNLYKYIKNFDKSSNKITMEFKVDPKILKDFISKIPGIQDSSNESESGSMNLKVEAKVNFKDVHICDGCGKPLSKCTCKVDTEELLKEDFYDDEYSDFDDSSVRVDGKFFKDGKDYYWVNRVSGPIYMDFDKWGVWEAISEDGDTAYFVVEEDTSFIDWGPCDIEDEAIEFLNSKNYDYLNEGKTFGTPADEYELDLKFDEWEPEYKKSIKRRRKKLFKDIESNETNISEENLDLSASSLEDDTLLIDINGTTYRYTIKDDSKYTASDMVRKVNKMREFSKGRALQFLKKNMIGKRVKTEALTESDDIISLVEDHFGTSDSPFKGPSFIMPDGKFLKLNKTHSEVEKWLYNQGLSDNYAGTITGSPTLKSLGCIRIDTPKYYIALPESINGVQFNSLLIWLDFVINSTPLKEIEVITPSSQIRYSLDPSDYSSDFPSDYIINKVRKYYITGELKESLENFNRFFVRNKIGESIATQPSSIGQHKVDSIDMMEDHSLNEYRGYKIQQIDGSVLIRDSKGDIVIEVDTDDDAKEYIDDLLDKE